MKNTLLNLGFAGAGLVLTVGGVVGAYNDFEKAEDLRRRDPGAVEGVLRFLGDEVNVIQHHVSNAPIQEAPETKALLLDVHTQLLYAGIGVATVASSVYALSK